MPRISPKKRAAFDILDWLFFNQTLFLRLSEDDETLNDDSPQAKELTALVDIMQRVNEEVASTGTIGVTAQALKHTIYCLLEVGFSDNIVQKSSSGFVARLGLTDERGIPLSKLADAFDPIQVATLYEYEQLFSSAVVAGFSKATHGVSEDTALAIATRVNATFSDAPAVVRFRLAERVFILEFMDAPLKFLSWMYRTGILVSKKFVAGRATSDIAEDFKTRIVLLCEFELMRGSLLRMMNKQSKIRRDGIRALQDNVEHRLSKAARTQLLDEDDFYKRLELDPENLKTILFFDLARLADDLYLHDVLERFAGQHRRSRFWTGPQHSWAGIVGSGMIFACHSLVDSQLKITRSGNNYSKTDKPLVQEDTVAQRICMQLNANGLVCRPASLYETYIESYMKRPSGLYHRAEVYLNLIREQDTVYPAWFHDITYLSFVVGSTP